MSARYSLPGVSVAIGDGRSTLAQRDTHYDAMGNIASRSDVANGAASTNCSVPSGALPGQYAVSVSYTAVSGNYNGVSTTATLILT